MCAAAHQFHSRFRPFFDCPDVRLGWRHPSARDATPGATLGTTLGMPPPAWLDAGRPGDGMMRAAGEGDGGVAGRAVDGRAAWATAIAATAILSVSFGAPQLLVVALVPIAEDLGGMRALPSLA